jgi:hypothetical protein
MSYQSEQAFVKNFVNALASKPVTYPDDYQQLPQNSLKKVPIFPVCIAYRLYMHPMIFDAVPR